MDHPERCVANLRRRAHVMLAFATAFDVPRVRRYWRLDRLENRLQRVRKPRIRQADQERVPGAVSGVQRALSVILAC